MLDYTLSFNQNSSPEFPSLRNKIGFNIRKFNQLLYAVPTNIYIVPSGLFLCLGLPCATDMSSLTGLSVVCGFVIYKYFVPTGQKKNVLKKCE